MKVKYNYNCEICENKKICKYYDKSHKYSNKEQIVKLRAKEEADKENLYVSINCKHYSSMPINTISTYASEGTSSAPINQYKSPSVFDIIDWKSQNSNTIVDKLQN